MWWWLPQTVVLLAATVALLVMRYWPLAALGLFGVAWCAWILVVRYRQMRRGL